MDEIVAIGCLGQLLFLIYLVFMAIKDAVA